MMIITESGTGQVNRSNETTWLTVPEATTDQYSNAQIASYRTRQEFEYQPPLRMTVTAHAEGALHGTAGFGFWNHPFVPGERGFHLPQAVWFFHISPPGNLPLAQGVPGYGWKAATFNAARWQFLAMLPTAPAGFLLMRIPAVYQQLWRIGQRALGVSEHLLASDLLKTPHQYVLEWLPDEVKFEVDGRVVHHAPTTVTNKLGFVAWVDNQYAIATPQGLFGAGLVETLQSQTLILRDLRITTLP